MFTEKMRFFFCLLQLFLKFRLDVGQKNSWDITAKRSGVETFG